MNSGPPSATTVLDRGDLGPLGEVVGSGGQAFVYRLPALQIDDVPGPLVYKEFRDGHRPPSGLVGIAAKRLALPTDERERLDRSATWPLRVVRDRGQDCGVVLRLIPDAFFQERRLPGSGRTVRTLREIQNLFVDRRLAGFVGMPFPETAERLAICRDFAAALHFMHRHELVVGDVNARNAAYRTDGAPRSVMLVDCDAVRVRGSAAVVAQLNAPDWEPPEGRSVLTIATDRYKFGLFVLRCLAPGPQASTGTDPTRAHEVLDDEGRALLERALGRDPAARPTMQEWGRHLQALIAPPPGAGSGASASAPASRRAVAMPARRRNRATGAWGAGGVRGGAVRGGRR